MQQSRKIYFNNKKNISKLWDNFKEINICVVEVLEEEKRGKKKNMKDK